MLSKLINAEKKVTDKGKTMFVCQFEYTQGDTNAQSFITLPNGMKVLNNAAASVRKIVLTKPLFPDKDSVSGMYAQNLDAFIQAKEANNVAMMQANQFSVNLCYVTKPLAELNVCIPSSDEICTKIYYTDKNGNEKELSVLSAVGFAKIDVTNPMQPIITDDWDDLANGFNADDYIKHNFDANIASGNYRFTPVSQLITETKQL